MVLNGYDGLLVPMNSAAGQLSCTLQDCRPLTYHSLSIGRNWSQVLHLAYSGPQVQLQILWSQLSQALKVTDKMVIVIQFPSFSYILHHPWFSCAMISFKQSIFAFCVLYCILHCMSLSLKSIELLFRDSLRCCHHLHLMREQHYGCRFLPQSSCRPRYYRCFSLSPTQICHFKGCRKLWMLRSSVHRWRSFTSTSKLWRWPSKSGGKTSNKYQDSFHRVFFVCKTKPLMFLLPCAVALCCSFGAVWNPNYHTVLYSELVYGLLTCLQLWMNVYICQRSWQSFLDFGKRSK